SAGASSDGDGYDAWCAARRRSAETRYAGIGQGPRFSVIVSVDDRNCRWLAECLASVVGQTYRAWQVIVIDQTAAPGGRLPSSIAADDRIEQVHGGADEDPVAVRARAARGASGDYLVFVDGSDLLDPYALAAFAEASDGGRSELLYADEDRIDAQGRRRDP